ncbi:MAG: methionine--tRNA ligase [Lentisphaeria bacterium]|nr:methionine--tRNA ligase [Lentisphaeria bacterium]
MDDILKFITTPIYYPNGDPHAGHAYTSVMADILKRWVEQNRRGSHVFLSTGVDEHGQKMEKLIRESGLSAAEYLDRKTASFRSIFNRLDVGYDAYVRTTDPHHIAGVQYALQKVYDQGYLEAQEYEGLYCEGCEMFKTPSELDEDGCCRDHKTRTVLLKEKNYVLPLEPHRAWLSEQIAEHPDWIRPEENRNEILQLLKEPLPPLCISRPKSRTQHGIELPFDHDYVTYVWFDALLNYVTVIGYPECGGRFGDLWGHSCHLIGKDIAKTHCIYWPIMLKALGLPLFGRIRIHGHWLGADGRKMSKSRGNVVDPVKVVDACGADPFRYYLAKNMTQTDSLMGYAMIDNCYNAELVNNISNATYRVLKMVKKNWPETLRLPAVFDAGDEHFLDEIFRTASDAFRLEPELENVRARACRIPEIATRINVYIDERKPWQLSGAEDAPRRDSLLLTLLEAVRLLHLTAWPVMPGTAQRILDRLNCPADLLDRRRFFADGQTIGEPLIVFMRKTLFPDPGEDGKESGKKTETKP